MLEQRGLGRNDLHDAMGGRSRVSEFFSGKRELFKAQVEALHRLLGTPTTCSWDWAASEQSAEWKIRRAIEEELHARIGA